MLELTLPFAPSTVTVSAALKLMRDVKRTAIVTEGPLGQVVFTADELLDELAERLTRGQQARLALGDLRPAFEGLQIPQRLNFIENSRSIANTSLTGSGAQYGVVGRSDKQARVLVAHEHFADRLRGQLIICVCTQDSDHVWRPSDLGPGKTCKADGAETNCG